VIRIFLLSTIIFVFSFDVPAQLSTRMSEHIYYSDFGSLKKIINDRYLRVLTTNNSVNYFIHQGEPTGIQYELVKRFVDSLNKRLAIKPPLIQFEMISAPKDQLVPLLLEGRGDIIAADLSSYENLIPEIAFSSRLREIKKVLLVNEQYKADDMIYSVGKVHYSTLKNLGVSPQNFKHINNELSEQDLVELTSVGQFNGVIVDFYIGNYFSENYSNLKIIKVQNEKLLPSSWVVRKENKELLDQINHFIPSVSVGSFLGNYLNLKYKKSATSIRFNNDNFKNNLVSPFDDLLQKYARKYKFNWLLLAALSFQESRFNQNRVSEAGAVGAFQVKESTAKEPYVGIFPIRGEKYTENNIHAGVKYLAWIKKSFFDSIPKMREKDRIRFSLAAYNAGPARILKAMKAAKKKGLDPLRWFRNVELIMIDMRLLEPVRYVSEINKRFVAYELLIKD